MCICHHILYRSGKTDVNLVVKTHCTHVKLLKPNLQMNTLPVEYLFISFFLLTFAVKSKFVLPKIRETIAGDH